MARLKTILKIGQSNSEGMAPWDDATGEVTDADFFRYTGENKPVSFANYDKTIAGIKVWTPRMPRAGVAITATGGTANTLVYTTGPAVLLNAFRDRWVMRTGGGAPGVPRFCSGNNAAGGGGVVTLTFDADWDVAPTTETFNILQGGTQGAGFDYATNPAASWTYEGAFRDLRIRYLSGADSLYTDGWEYTNLHGMPLGNPALALSLRFAGPMFEHTYLMKREIPSGEDLWVVMMPLPYSFMSPRYGPLAAIQNLDFSWQRSARTNDWSPLSSDPAGNPATFDLYHLFFHYILGTAIPAWLAANRPGDSLDVIEMQIALGESDSGEGWRAAQAGVNMRYLRDSARARVKALNATTLPANRIPWVMNGMDTDATAYPGGSVVNPQYEALAEEDPYTWYVHTDDMQARTGIDPLHFCAGRAGYVTIGEREVQGWREILKADARQSAFAAYFDVVRPVWAIDLGGGEYQFTADYDHLQTLPAARRLWVAGYTFRDAGTGRLPLYLEDSRRRATNIQHSAVDEFIGYAEASNPTGGMQLASTVIIAPPPPGSDRPARSTTKGSPVTQGSVFATGSALTQFSEDSASFLDTAVSEDATGVTNTIIFSRTSNQVGRWQVTHPGLGLADYDILLRGNGYAKALAHRELVSEDVGTDEYRKHMSMADYRSEIEHGNRESYPGIPRGHSRSSTLIRSRWVPLEFSPNGRAEETTLSRFTGNHGALIHEQAIYRNNTYGVNLQPNWNGIYRAHKVTLCWSTLFSFFLGGTHTYSNGGGVWLRRVFDKVYTWTPGTDTMTDKLWAPGTNRNWEVTPTAINEYDSAGVLQSTGASPFTNGYGALVWRATGTHYGANTDLTVAMYSQLVAGDFDSPGTMRISNYTSGAGDVGGYASYDQVNGWCQFRLDRDSALRFTNVRDFGYAYFLVIGSFAEVQATLNSLYAVRASYGPDSDISPNV